MNKKSQKDKETKEKKQLTTDEILKAAMSAKMPKKKRKAKGSNF